MLHFFLRIDSNSCHTFYSLSLNLFSERRNACFHDGLYQDGNYIHGVKVAFCVFGVIAILSVGVLVVTMYKEASRDVSKSSKDTFKAEQTSNVYDADGNEIKKLKQEAEISIVAKVIRKFR